jgi:hypothetical protein
MVESLKAGDRLTSWHRSSSDGNVSPAAFEHRSKIRRDDLTMEAFILSLDYKGRIFSARTSRPPPSVSPRHGSFTHRINRLRLETFDAALQKGLPLFAFIELRRPAPCFKGK